MYSIELYSSFRVVPTSYSVELLCRTATLSYWVLTTMYSLDKLVGGSVAFAQVVVWGILLS